MDPELSEKLGTSFPAMMPGTLHSVVKAFWNLAATLMDSPDTMDWNSHCSNFHVAEISGATNKSLSQNAEMPNCFSVLLDTTPTSPCS